MFQAETYWRYRHRESGSVRLQALRGLVEEAGGQKSQVPTGLEMLGYMFGLFIVGASYREPSMTS